MNTREAALKTLYEIEYNGAFSNIAVKNMLKNQSMTIQEKGFYTRLVYGTLDKKITLDYIIEKFSKIKLKKLSKYIHLILRMGIYQLKYMDYVPDSAAVNESVKLARRYGHGASAGYVNGLLRNVSKNDIKYPDSGVNYLSVKYSFPIEMCLKWVNDFGYDFTEDLLRSFESEPILILRPNTLKISADELADKFNKKGIKSVSENGYVRSEGFDIAEDNMYINGMYTVQDYAAMQAAIVLDPQSGSTVIDMCAAPGGKTTHIAELMQNRGTIYAFDVYEHKVELIKKNTKRLGIDIIKAKLKDATVFDEALKQSADKILCDVPCTGTGIIRRKPDIKYTRINDGSITDIQKKILDNASQYLKSGGELVYSTCSIEKEENEGITGEFLLNNTGFEKIYEKTMYPNIDGCDGFYICKIRKLQK